LGEAREGGHDGVAFFGLSLVAHAQVAAGAIEIHHVHILGARGGFGVAVVEFEARVFPALQTGPSVVSGASRQKLDDGLGSRIGISVESLSAGLGSV
jgi:hypothetical protein